MSPMHIYTITNNHLGLSADKSITKLFTVRKLSYNMELIVHYYLLQFLIFTPTIIANNLQSSNNLSPSFEIPSTAKPDHYSIKLHINSTDNDRIFYGETNITIEVMVPTNVLYLHARRLIISEINLTLGNGSVVKPFNYSIDITTDVLTVKFVETIYLGKYILNIIYTGAINDNQQGLMRGFYTNDDNKPAYFLASSLPRTGARQVFPCWDKPALKANFTIIIKHEACYTPISNMHAIKIERDERDPRMQTTIFANTPKMSTYSVTIIISNFSYHESNSGVIRVWSTNSTINKMKYVVDIIPKILDKLKNFTNISYTDMGFEKIDIVALPYKSEFTGGWGLITIFEDLIAIDDAVADTAVKEDAMILLSRVCATQWLRNLISPPQWSDSWFNKGVEIYLEFLIVEQIMPSWHIMDRMLADISMSMSENRGSNYLAIYDSFILSQKSVIMIHMASHVFGNLNLQKVLQKYLHDHAFQTASFNDFIDAWSGVAGDNEIPILPILNSSITTSEFSVMIVQRNYTAGTAVISQSRYLTNHHDSSGNYDENYWVPINYASQDSMDSQNSTIIHWLNRSNQSIEISGLKDDKWVIFNKYWFSYYYVNYDIKNWQLIIKALKSNNHGNIHVHNRIELLRDAIQLVSIGQLDYGTLISLLGYLENETDPLPWITIAFRIILKLKIKLLSSKYYVPLMEYMSKLPNKLVEKIGFNERETDDYSTKLYRNSMMSIFCGWGVPSCVNKAVESLTKHLNNPKNYTLPSKLRQVIFCNGVRGGNQSVWDAMKHKWLITHDPEILFALGCSLNEINLNELLSQTSVADIDEMTTKMIFDAVRLGSDLGQNIAIDFVIRNWQSMNPKYRHVSLHHAAVFISQKSHFEKIHHFVTSNDELNNDVKLKFMVFSTLKRRLANYDLKIPELDKFFNYSLNQNYAHMIPSIIVVEH